MHPHPTVEKRFPQPRRRYLGALLILLGASLFGLALFQALWGYLLTWFFPFGFDALMSQSLIVHPEKYEGASLYLLLYQGLVAVSVFLAIPALVWRLYLRHPLQKMSWGKAPTVLLLLLTALVTVFSLPGIQYVAEWNNAIEFPQAFGQVEELFKNLEEQNRRLTEAMTQFSTFGHFLLGLFVVAVLAGVGEEFLFRGFIQNLFHRLFGQLHLAIWLTGFLFSAIHLQFYGFFPRMLLGVAFGYLYYWSGRLVVPILAHVINNAFVIVVLYFNQQGSLHVDTENVGIPYKVALISLVVTAALLYVFRDYTSKRQREKAR